VSCVTTKARWQAICAECSSGIDPWLNCCRVAFPKVSWSGFAARGRGCLRSPPRSASPAAALTKHQCASTFQRCSMGWEPGSRRNSTEARKHIEGLGFADDEHRFGPQQFRQQVRHRPVGVVDYDRRCSGGDCTCDCRIGFFGHQAPGTLIFAVRRRPLLGRDHAGHPFDIDTDIDFHSLSLSGLRQVNDAAEKNPSGTPYADVEPPDPGCERHLGPGRCASPPTVLGISLSSRPNPVPPSRS
jgi:hypothetical protein